MKKVKRILAFAAAAAMLTACGKAAPENGAAGNTAAGNAGAAEEGNAVQTEQAETMNVIYDAIKTEFGSPDLSDYPLTASNVPADFEAVYEAEAGELTGNAVALEDGEASGGGFVFGVNTEKDTVTFAVDIEYDGFYDCNFVSRTDNVTRENYVFLDDEKIGSLYCNNHNVYGDSILGNVYLTAGSHRFTIVPSWGYVDYDCLKLTANKSITADTYKITAALSNPNADDHTKRLYKFLCDIYGKYTLTGQYADKGRQSSEYNRIAAKTGSHFAVLGMDMMGYSPGAVEHGSSSNTVEYAYDFYTHGGGIVTLCWHWHAPAEYQINSDDQPWYKAFYKEAATIDLDKIMNGEDEKGYELLMSDIDAISEQLRRLRDAGVPVLWRPLHEASGGWFWWGNCSAESYKKLWNVMYDKMTNEHGLTNLIWVWNAQSTEWYPGDDTVDIVSADIYAGNQVESCYCGSFAELASVTGESKLIALSENGCVMDPDKVMLGNSRWLFWATWSDPFTLKMAMLNDEYTKFETLEKAYASDRTLTLEELPDLKNYPLD